MELQGKVAVVTGGAIRVGRALTLALAQAGCHVFIHYGSSANLAIQTRADVQKLGVEADIYSANLLDVTETQNIIPAAVERFGLVNILINSAAIRVDPMATKLTCDPTKFWPSHYPTALLKPDNNVLSWIYALATCSPRTAWAAWRPATRPMSVITVAVRANRMAPGS